MLRLHGSRNGHDRTRDIIEPTGGDNEIWSFGERNFNILRELIMLRERLKPYIKAHMDIASEKGIPVMRPMFFDYPEDEICYTLEGQYMFGDDIIFAPITERGQTDKEVYLPSGEWILTKDKSAYEGNGNFTIRAELNEFVAFVKKGKEILSAF